MIRIKRVYEPALRSDGKRILVERLWPRGVKKDDLAADAWLKDVAPSTKLRHWFGHRVERWSEFRRRYRRELDARPEAWKPILVAGRRGTVTLLYAAHDTLHNGALVLQEYLEGRSSSTARRRRGTTRGGVAGAAPARKRRVRASAGRKR